jgi:hypothetical protein
MSEIGRYLDPAPAIILFVSFLIAFTIARLLFALHKRRREGSSVADPTIASLLIATCSFGAMYMMAGFGFFLFASVFHASAPSVALRLADIPATLALLAVLALWSAFIVIYNSWISIVLGIVLSIFYSATKERWLPRYGYALAVFGIMSLEYVYVVSVNHQEWYNSSPEGRLFCLSHASCP